MKSECDEMDDKTIEELSNEDHEYDDLAYAMQELERRQTRPGVVEDIIAGLGIYPFTNDMIQFFGEALERAGKIDRKSKRYELAYYMSGQGEAPVLYVDWNTAKVHDIFTLAERPDCLWYENGEPMGFKMSVYLSGERFPAVDGLRTRAFEIAP